MYEAIDDIVALERVLGNYPAYAELKAVLDDSETAHLRKGLLHRLRNKAVFHFDNAVIPQGIRTIAGADVVFVSGSGLQRVNSYYDLADIVVMYFVLESPATMAAFESAAAEALLSIAKLGSQVANASDGLIREVLLGFGGKVRRAAA